MLGRKSKLRHHGYQDYEDWHLDEEISKDWCLNFTPDDEDPFIAVDFPEREQCLLLQIPKENGWAHFESCVNEFLGENTWIAGFYSSLQPPHGWPQIGFQNTTNWFVSSG
jgi:hypothetical protein